MTQKKFLMAVLFLSWGNFTCLQAQEILNPEDAIRIALENGYDIVIAQKDLEIRKNDNTRGNAGFLPRVDLDAGYSGSRNDTRQEFLDGRTQSVNGAINSRLNGAINATWTVFDGFIMFNRYRNQNIAQENAQLNLRLEMENTIAEILTSYYEITYQEQTLEILRKNLDVSRERLRVANDRYELGVFSKLDLLRAQVDFNEDSSSVIDQVQVIFESKTNMNLLLNREATLIFGVKDSIPLSSTLAYEPLRAKLIEKNTQIKIAQKDISASELEVQVARGDRYPTVDLNLGYELLRSKSGAGFLSSNRNFGLNYGVSLNYNLFDGNNVKREIANAEIEKLKADEDLKNTKVDIQTSFEITYKNYLKNYKLMELEVYNVSVAQQNLEIAIEKYKLGGLSALDFRDIQQDALQATSKLNEIRYLIKSDELELMRISGELIQENNRN